MKQNTYLGLNEEQALSHIKRLIDNFEIEKFDEVIKAHTAARNFFHSSVTQKGDWREVLKSLKDILRKHLPEIIRGVSLNVAKNMPRETIKSLNLSMLRAFSALEEYPQELGKWNAAIALVEQWD